MKKLIFFSMLFLASIVSHAQTSYGGLITGDAGLNPSPTCTYFGTDAGDSNTTGSRNTFIGVNAGQDNLTGRENTFIGTTAGGDNMEGRWNVFVGSAAGRSNAGGAAHRNTYIGNRAGANNVNGGGNVFLGNEAGLNEMGRNRLYIHNDGTDEPLIEGTFNTRRLTLNGTVGVGDDIPVGPNIPTDIQLYVDGRFSQLDDGVLGGFTPNDRWSSLGESFAPQGVAIPEIYGLLNQGYGATFVSGVKNIAGQANSTIGWSADRLDFDVINPGNPLQTRLSILRNGNVGIGTTTPESQLNIVGNNPAITLSNGNGATLQLASAECDGCYSPFAETNDQVIRMLGSNDIIFSTSASSGAGRAFKFVSGNNFLMEVNDNGRVFIGDPTTVQTPPGYRLYVKDGILTERVRVENCVDWADYVFEEDYERNTTEEVEQFVRANKHLPNVPSAKEVSENGIDMAEMDATLLRQIEELWLHVIDLKKENEVLKNEVESLRE